MADGSNTKLDDLQIDIVVNAKEAGNALSRVASALKNVGRSSGGVKTASSNLRDLGNATESSGKKVRNLQKELDKTKGKLQDAENNVKKLKQQLKETGNETQKASGRFKTFLSNIGRIAMYRAIRSAIKTVTQAVSEGFNMFVTWDREQNNGMAGVAANVDKVTASWTILKGQIGAAAGALFNSFAPAITFIIDGLTKIVDLFQMVIRSLQGEYTYYKLIYKSAKATTEQARALKRVLFGFDELNVLPGENGGGIDPTGGGWAYESVPIESAFLNKIADASNKIRDLLGLSKDWQNALGGVVGVLGTILGIKGLGGLLGMLPNLISGLRGKNSALADQTAQTQADASAAKNLATKLGTVLGTATAVAVALKKKPIVVNITSKVEDIVPKVSSVMENARTYLSSQVLTFNSALGVNSAAMATILSSTISALQATANANPVVIPVVQSQALAGASGAASGVSAKEASMLDKLNSQIPTFKDQIAALDLEIPDAVYYSMYQYSENKAANALTDWLKGIKHSSVPMNPLFKGVNSINGFLTVLSLMIPALVFAKGGVPDTGTLFYAGEAGAEVVANAGRHTGVMNVNQMQEAVASGNVEVINAIYGMANMIVNAVNSKDLDVYMDGNQIGKSVTRYQNNQARRGISTQGAY